MAPLSAVALWHLDKAIRLAGVVIDGVTAPDAANRTTWTVTPPGLQGAAQQTIDAFNPDDPALVQADLDGEVMNALDAQRLYSAIVWAIIDQFAAPASIPKYNIARTKIIAAYKAQPWKP